MMMMMIMMVMVMMVVVMVVMVMVVLMVMMVMLVMLVEAPGWVGSGCPVTAEEPRTLGRWQMYEIGRAHV